MVEPPELRRPSLSSSSGSSKDGGQTAQTQRTNTLIITKVPPALLSQAVTPSLKEFFENYGKIEAWIPLKSFERVVVVYEHEEHAEQAKLGLDYTLVEGFGPSGTGTSSSNTILRVYRGPPTPLETLRDRHYRNTLPVPTTDRNFLISPPGSPPVGWEQAREDPPNMDTLADDLARALDQLTYSRFDDEESETGDRAEEEDEFNEPPSALRNSIPQSPRDTLIIPHRRTESGSLPSVMVSDTDAIEPVQASRNGLSLEQAFAIQRRTPTSRPPGPISQVKATVESLQDSAFHPSGPRIDRTPRPPLAG